MIPTFSGSRLLLLLLRLKPGAFKLRVKFAFNSLVQPHLATASCVNHFSRSVARSASLMAPMASGHRWKSSCITSAAATLRLSESANPRSGR
jgi:hypothetical protein